MDAQTIQSLQEQAIASASSANWSGAIRFNKQILENDPINISAMNRAAYCYLQLGKSTTAKRMYAKVLEMDPFNSIAKKHLQMIKAGNIQISSGAAETKETFIEEPGKTKTVQLCRPADPEFLRSLRVAISCKLIVRNRRIIVHTADEKYIGCLPDDIAHSLRKLIELGHEYRTVVRSINKQEVEVFVREVSRGSQAKQFVSFPYTNGSKPSSNTTSAIIHEELMINDEPELDQGDDSGSDSDI